MYIWGGDFIISIEQNSKEQNCGVWHYKVKGSQKVVYNCLFIIENIENVEWPLWWDLDSVRVWTETYHLHLVANIIMKANTCLALSSNNHATPIRLDFFICAINSLKHLGELPPFLIKFSATFHIFCYSSHFQSLFQWILQKGIKKIHLAGQ